MFHIYVDAITLYIRLLQLGMLLNPVESEAMLFGSAAQHQQV